MKIDKWIKSLAKNFTGDKNIRPTLASVFFTWNKAVATNAFKICEIEFDETKMIWQDALEFKDFIYRTDEDVLISKDDILKLDIPKSKYTDFLNYVYIWNVKDENLTLRSFDWNNHSIINCKQNRWKFPDYTSFFGNDNISTIWFWVNEMIELLQTYKDNWVHSIKMQIWSPLQGIEFSVNNKSEIEKRWIKEIKSLLMPIKI